ncbi:peptide deformylase [Candidatus Kaiserbacteria bacterium CG10_big_fil_rev_8_21_14_0_10_56_12]|uniref:Peptide deformylase n=1 Tax=Candidatus Kaiserbacteria bacterium CG10_big_fil_rev_8_21_14_0_10_56_12 TaxID=1974611 RepID=A0A2H0U9S0_9BACT|nr:MAG: peptide deformylase [Candidatus Kaiserbacteria bacterium CG10_big_fil_rev_8_21_14_0_10_56_12]
MSDVPKPIVQKDSPVLRRVASVVPTDLFNSPELDRLIRDMSEALDGQPEGVALAAPQIGVSMRLFIVRVDRTLSAEEIEKRGLEPAEVPPQVEVYLNPEIIKTSRKRANADEGCLSVKGVYGTTHPHERVTLRAQRADGTTFERGAGGLMAQIFEHEVSHLNGILFIDHADNLFDIPHDEDSK